MPTQVNHRGFECPVLLDGVDLHVTKWDGTSTTTELTRTNTSHYVPAEDRCYKSVIGGVTSFEGTINFEYDSNNKPWPNLRDGNFVELAELQCDNTGTKISCRIYIKTLKIAPDNIDGLVTGEITFSSDGKVTYA